ncbi:MAG: c-type cytochrome domain-containing protein, partial [Planctomycetaceae bacterium]
MRFCCIPAVLIITAWFNPLLADDEPGPITAEVVVLERPVDFRQDVLPILRTKCLACHSASVKEGKLVLESADGLLQGGDSGPAVVAGKPEESLLLKLASRTEESFMPPLPNDANAKPLTPRELGLLTVWIREGAQASTGGGPAINWQSLPAGLQPIYSLALSPDETLVAAGRGNRIAVYDVLRQRLVATLTDPALGDAAHRDFVHALDFSPDGQWLASGGYRLVKLWRQASPIEEQRPLEGAVAAMAVSPDGNWLAIARSDGSLRLEPRAPGGEPRILEGTGAAVSALGFTPDSAGLLQASGPSIRRINVADGAIVGDLTTPAPVTALIQSPDGAQLVTGHTDGVIRVWSSTQIAPQANGAPAEAAAPQAELRGHEKPVTALAWANAEGPRLVSASEDGTHRQWDVAAGTETRKLEQGAPISAVTSSPDGKQVATLGSDGIVRVWEAAGNKLADLQGDPRQAHQIARLKENLNVARSRKSIAEAAVGETEKDITGREESLKKAGEQLAAAQKAVEEARPKAAEAEQKQKEATDAAASKPDDEALKKAQTDAEAATKAAQDALTKAEDGVVSAQRGVELSEKSIATAKADLETRKQRRDAEAAAEQLSGEAVTAAEAQAKESTPALRKVAYTSDGSALATVDANGLVTLWHVATQRAIVTIPTEAATAAIAASSDGRLLAAIEDGRLMVLRTEPRWELAGQLGPAEDAGADVTSSILLGRVLAIDFSPDGTRLATGSGVPSRNGQLAIWNVAERTLDKEIPEAHSDTVFSVTFSRDGALLASGAADKFAKVFDTATGEIRNTLEG